MGPECVVGTRRKVREKEEADIHFLSLFLFPSAGQLLFFVASTEEEKRKRNNECRPSFLFSFILSLILFSYRPGLILRECA